MRRGMCKSCEQTIEVIAVRGLRSVLVRVGLLHEGFGHHERALFMKAIMIGEAAVAFFNSPAFGRFHRARSRDMRGRKRLEPARVLALCRRISDRWAIGPAAVVGT